LQKTPSKKEINDFLENYKSGYYGEAEKLAYNFTKKFPSYSFGWKALGVVLKKNGKISEALEANQKSLQINPQDEEVYFNLANTLKDLNRGEEALVYYKKAINLKPDYLEAYNNLGIILRELKKFKEAEANYIKAIQINPNFADAYNNLGISQRELNKLEESEASYKKAIGLKTDFADAYNNLGITLRELKRLKESEASYKKAIQINPNFADAYNNLGYTLRELGRLDESETSYKKAIELKPNFADAYNNFGFVLRELGRLDESETSYKKAIELKPNFADAYNNLSFTLLLKGNFEEAFRLSEWRWKTELKIGTEFYSKKPVWSGQNKSSVFVWREQGIGDEIMFCSILPELIEKSKNIILNCDKRLIPLFNRSLSDKVSYQSKQNDVDENKYDFHISMGSLPLYFRKDLASFSNSSKGYLKADKTKIYKFRKQLSNKKNVKLIGLSWHTKSQIQMASFRNISLKNLVSEINNSEVKFINLQYGDVSEEIKELKKKLGIDIIDLREVDKRDDIDSLAALVSACDFVVSIDNFILHLAGSLGVKTMALLPFSSDSRWGSQHNKCHLYDSVSLYRQTVLGDWKKVLKQLKKDISREYPKV